MSLDGVSLHGMMSDQASDEAMKILVMSIELKPCRPVRSTGNPFTYSFMKEYVAIQALNKIS